MMNIDGLRIFRDNKDSNRIIFEFTGTVNYYMSSSCDKFIVINANYFDAQWRKTSFVSQKLLANIENKKNDEKYKDAETGFLDGEKNPVPVVYAYIEIENNDDIIPTLNNGLSRTNYLLANKVKYLVFSVDDDLKIPKSDFYFLIDKYAIK